MNAGTNGDHPRWVAQALLSAAAGDGVDTDGLPDDSPDDDGEGEQPGQQAVVNGHGGA